MGLRRAIQLAGDCVLQHRPHFPATETRYGQLGEKRAKEFPFRAQLAGRGAPQG
jgi:hypothetical protein